VRESTPLSYTELSEQVENTVGGAIQGLSDTPPPRLRRKRRTGYSARCCKGDGQASVIAKQANTTSLSSRGDQADRLWGSPSEPQIPKSTAQTSLNPIRTACPIQSSPRSRRSTRWSDRDEAATECNLDNSQLNAGHSGFGHSKRGKSTSYAPRAWFARIRSQPCMARDAASSAESFQGLLRHRGPGSPTGHRKTDTLRFTTVKMAGLARLHSSAKNQAAGGSVRSPEFDQGDSLPHACWCQGALG